MDYELRGTKIKALLSAMDADRPERIWSAEEIAAVMQVKPYVTVLHPYTRAAIKAGLLFHRIEGHDHQYRRVPFDAVPAPTRSPQETTSNGWTPPKMKPPRGESAPIPSRVTAAAAPAGSVLAIQPLQVDREPADQAETRRPDAEVQDQPRPPETAPALADASIPEGASAEQEQQAQPVDWCRWDDGDVDFFGLVELEGGGYRMPKDAVDRFRKFIAWMPA